MLHLFRGRSCGKSLGLEPDQSGSESRFYHGPWAWNFISLNLFPHWKRNWSQQTTYHIDQVGELNEKIHIKCLTWDMSGTLYEMIVTIIPFGSLWGRCERSSSSVTQRDTKAQTGPKSISWVSVWVQSSDEPSSVLPCFSVCKIFASNLPRLALSH